MLEPVPLHTASYHGLPLDQYLNWAFDVTCSSLPKDLNFAFPSMASDLKALPFLEDKIEYLDYFQMQVYQHEHSSKSDPIHDLYRASSLFSIWDVFVGARFRHNEQLTAPLLSDVNDLTAKLLKDHNSALAGLLLANPEITFSEATLLATSLVH